ncbi:MAG: DUF521 domain-containing protein [Methanomassiliicoccus sp.]|nr:DUF521 domain-containing protein [Methanomassiliicoccus sp.]
MHLDRDQERALGGENGEAVRWATQEVVRAGERAGASRLVPVRSVHIPDWYRHRGSKEWEHLRSKIGEMDVPVTANPGGLDDEMSLNCRSILERLRPRGAHACSCAPHLSGNHPDGGQVVAWGGRAASSFVNSILGARSEVEDFRTSMASAITGLTAERGLLLEENRRPTMAVVVPSNVGRDFALLGSALSVLVRDEVPLICGPRPDYDEAKRFAFAINGEGRVPLFHLHGPMPPRGLEVAELDASGWRACLDEDLEPDLLMLGCPHLSEQDINRWGRYLSGRRPGRAEAWFLSSRLCVDKCPHTGAVLASRGRILTDRCPLTMIDEIDGRTVGCDSPALASCLSSAGVHARPLSCSAMAGHLARD